MQALSHPKLNDAASDHGAAAFLSRRDTAVRDFAERPFPRHAVAICITVYNEADDALHASLAGLADSLAFARRHAPDLSINLFIAVDGLDKCALSMRVALQSLLKRGLLTSSDPNDVTCHYCELNLEELIVTAGGRAPHGADGTAHVLIVVKQSNQGKLDSHWWFYRAFCSAVTPAYCFQMDVGTVPTSTSFTHLLQAFQEHASVGAVAASILPQSPVHAFDVLAAWQYVSFANASFLEWPAENMAGFLSVVPGQLSAVRWDAIKDSQATTQVLGQPRLSPLDVYFKGLGKLSPREAMLYAAEDRVLCREIVFTSTDEWSVAHVDAAVAITDPCLSWDELLRQRKRWCNGYMACRLAFLKTIPGFIGLPQIGGRRKTRAVVAGTYHALVLMLDWFVLAIAILFFSALYSRAASLTELPTIAARIFENGMKVALAVLSVQLFVCWRGCLSKGFIRTLVMSAYLQMSLVGASLLALALFSKDLMLGIALAFQLFAAPLATLLGQRRFTSAVLKAAPAMFLSIHVVHPLLWMFAICNCHDSSWGTKGLLANTNSSNGINLPAADYIQVRNRYVFAWLGSNLLVAYLLAGWCRGHSATALIITVAVSCSCHAIGLLCRLYNAIPKIRGNDEPKVPVMSASGRGLSRDSIKDEF